MTEKEILEAVEHSIVYFDHERLDQHKEALWNLFLRGKIESRLVVKHGIPMAEIIKPFDPSTL